MSQRDAGSESTRSGSSGASNGGSAPRGDDARARGSRGLPTGLKVVFGCVGAVALGAIVLIVALGVGGFALKRGVESTVGSIDEHREASASLARLEREHPFEVPSDGVVGDERLRRFLAVTDRAWEEIRPWAAEVERFRARADSEDGVRIRDAFDGARAAGGLGRSRVALARALDAEGMSLGAYAWTGHALSRAVEISRRGGSSPQVPAQNLELVARHAGELPDFESDEPGPATVLAVANFWGLSEATTWQALGLDTLVRH